MHVDIDSDVAEFAFFDVVRTFCTELVTKLLLAFVVVATTITLDTTTIELESTGKIVLSPFCMEERIEFESC